MRRALLSAFAAVLCVSPPISSPLASPPPDQEGRYRIAAVPPGAYEISAELLCAVRRGVGLTLGAESVINGDRRGQRRGDGPG